MTIHDDALLAEFRAPGLCGWCQKPCQQREGHHLFYRGLGGGSTLDIRINLISLGSTQHFHPCHGLAHAGKIDKDSLLIMVAAREGVMQPDITHVIWFLRRLSKTPTDAEIREEMDGMGPGAIALAWKTLKEARKVA